MVKKKTKMSGNSAFFLNSQEVQGRMLTTDTFSPLHRLNPASHSLMVCVTAVASAPIRTHTFNPGVKQSAESLQ